MNLDEIAEFIKANCPYDIIELHEEAGPPEHVFVRMALKIASGQIVPYPFALLRSKLDTDPKAAIMEWIGIMASDRELMFGNGIPRGGLPIWG